MEITLQDFMNKVAEEQAKSFFDDLCSCGDSEEPFIGSEQQKYPAAEAAKLPPRKSEDLMLMAELADRDRRPPTQTVIEKRPLNSNTVNHTVPPMMKSDDRTLSNLDRIMNGLLGVMIAVLVVCLMILIWVWQ